MDLLTHGLLGATLAQATYSRRLGYKSLVVGAIAAMVPDMDMVVRFFGGILSEFKYHRSLTHSFWFGPVVAWFMSLYLHRKYSTKRWDWFWLITLVILSHPFLDICTSYGTQFFYPFHTMRVRWNIISIIDLGFTPILIITLMVGYFFSKKHRLKAMHYTGIIGVVMSMGYLKMCEHIQTTLMKRVEKEGPWLFYEIHPTFFQPHMRRVYARRPDAVCVTYMHYTKHPTYWVCRPQVYSKEVKDFLKTPLAQTFVWYAGDNIYIEHDKINRHIHLHDIRYSLPQSPFKGIWSIKVSYDDKGHYDPLHMKGGHVSWKDFKEYIAIIMNKKPWYSS